MLEPLILIVALAVIVAVLLGAGLFSLLILGAVFLLILFITKAILIAVLVLLVLASPFIAVGILSKLCQGRTFPGTTWPLGRTMVIGGIVILALTALTIGDGANDMESLMNNSRKMMELCDQGGDHSSDMVMGDRHFHFSCHKEAPPGQDL